MKRVFLFGGACVLAGLLSGCTPELDQTGLSPEEQMWAESFRENYGAWKQPESVPRSVRRNDLPTNDFAVAAGEPAAAPAVDAAAVENTPVAPVEEVVPPAAVAVETPVEVVAPPQAEAAEEYVVVKGDTLSHIALKFYGRASAWKKIVDANADVLKGKTVIRPGMKLMIPRP